MFVVSSSSDKFFKVTFRPSTVICDFEWSSCYLLRHILVIMQHCGWQRQFVDNSLHLFHSFCHWHIDTINKSNNSKRFTFSCNQLCCDRSCHFNLLSKSKHGDDKASKGIQWEIKLTENQMIRFHCHLHHSIDLDVNEEIATKNKTTKYLILIGQTSSKIPIIFEILKFSIALQNFIASCVRCTVR